MTNFWIAAIIIVLILVSVKISVPKPNKRIANKVDPVLKQLNSNGDNNYIARMVDHWIYFNSKEDIDTFMNKASEEGFSLLSFQDSQDSQYKYVVNIGREQNVLRRHMIQTVAKLDLLAQKHNGDYDGWGCMNKK